MRLRQNIQHALKQVVRGVRSATTAFRNEYEAGQPTDKRKRRTDRGSGDYAVSRAGDQLRIQARHLDENHDLATGILDTLVNRTVGRGIRYEPQVLDVAGDLHDEFNEVLLDLHTRWSEKPDVTGDYSRADLERLFARTWFRDGEAFKVYHSGTYPTAPHHTPTPFSLEVFEADLCPLGLSDPDGGIIQGVRKNGWGAPRSYFFHRGHPGDARSTHAYDYREVSSRHVNHLKLTKRLGQTRGISAFHAVLQRLDDLKDYEEAERVAARIAAKMVGYVKKGLPESYGSEVEDSDGEPLQRERQAFEDGMIIYDMMPGEEVGLFDNTKRPNNGLNEFRSGQLRATAAGSMTSYSSSSKDYNGTYSAQRQELVEQQEMYEVLQDYFVNHSCKPDYRRFVDMAILSGQIKVPGNIRVATLRDVACYGTAMPWVDPQKEAKAHAIMLEEGLISRSEVIRRSGRNPSVVFKQIKRDEQKAGHKVPESPAKNLKKQAKQKVAKR